MPESQFLAMVSGYAQFYAPMMEIWRELFLAICIIGGVLLGTVLLFQRGLSSYL
jgi:hypothetical protein